VQLDELRTRLRSCSQVLWLWLAIDPCTKLLPVLYLGPRTQNAAHRIIHSLRQLLAPGCLPLFTSDGLNLYFYALTAHFGHWLRVVRRGRKVLRWQVVNANCQMTYFAKLKLTHPFCQLNFGSSWFLVSRWENSLTSSTSVLQTLDS